MSNKTSPKQDGWCIESTRSAQVLGWIGVVVVVASLVGGEHTYAALGYPLLLAALCLVGIVALLPWGGAESWQRLMRGIGPIAAFATVQLVVYEVAAWQVTRLPRLHAVIITIGLSWIAAAVLGWRARSIGSLGLHTAVGVPTVLSALVALVTFDESLGFSTALSKAYWAWDAAVGIGAASPRGWLVLRAMGFERDANAFGMLGAIALAIALTVPARRWVGPLIGACGLTIVVLSGSRTAWVAALMVTCGWLAVRWLDTRGTALRPRSLKRVFLVGCAIAAVLTVTVVLLSAYVYGNVQPGSGSASSPLLGNALLSGRAEIWAEALTVYRAHPLGTFQLAEAFLGRSVHNEYIERLLIGGPLYLAALVVFLTWLALGVRPRIAPALGLCLAAAYATAACALGPSMIPSFTTLVFFTVGWAQAEVAADAAVAGPKRAKSRAKTNR
jgi:hypothetical protein